MQIVLIFQIVLPRLALGAANLATKNQAILACLLAQVEVQEEVRDHLVLLTLKVGVMLTAIVGFNVQFTNKWIYAPVIQVMQDVVEKQIKESRESGSL